MKLLDRFYEKSEIGFAIAWIVAYVVLASFADSASLDLGVPKLVTAPVLLLMVAILWLWVRHANLEEKYGLRAPIAPAARMLLYLPLVIMASRKLWFGIAVTQPVHEVLLYIVSMCCVGFLEELIMRGLLFRAMAKDGMTSAIIVSSLTFGIGHFVNAINASGQSLWETAGQVVFAVIIGFVLVFVLLRSGSLWPCIIFHAVINSLSVFENEAAELAVLGPTGVWMLVLGVSLVVGGGYLIYLLKQEPLEE